MYSYAYTHIYLYTHRTKMNKSFLKKSLDTVYCPVCCSDEEKNKVLIYKVFLHKLSAFKYGRRKKSMFLLWWGANKGGAGPTWTAEDLTKQQGKRYNKKKKNPERV